jgi:hypothetical protein
MPCLTAVGCIRDDLVDPEWYNWSCDSPTGYGENCQRLEHGLMSHDMDASENAAKKSRRSFTERLDNFTRNVDDSHADEVFTPSRMPFWALERSWEYTAPKSVVLIRRMLRRIRHWVRWGVS